LALPKRLISKLSGVVRVKYLLRMAEITSGNSFELNNLRNLFWWLKMSSRKALGEKRLTTSAIALLTLKGNC